MSGWLGLASELVPVLIEGSMAAASAWRSRRDPLRPSEGPRPLDAALVAMLKKRKEQRDNASTPSDNSGA